MHSLSVASDYLHAAAGRKWISCPLFLALQLFEEKGAQALLAFSFSS